LGATESVLVEALLRFGPIGLVVIALAIGWLYTKPHVEDLRKALVDCREELKGTREELRAQNQIMREILVPAVTQSTQLVQRVGEELLWRQRAS
jgi:hypothetical protein